jgi:hypothetical protein
MKEESAVKQSMRFIIGVCTFHEIVCNSGDQIQRDKTAASACDRREMRAT